MGKTINVLIVIDTDSIKSKFAKNANSSTPVNLGVSGTKDAYMISSGAAIVSGQGTDKLIFKALVGDTLRSFAVSGSNNFEDAVVIYNFHHISGDHVVNPPGFGYQSFTTTGVTGGTPMPLPVATEKHIWWFYTAMVNSSGTEYYKVQFGLYERNKDTGKQELYGYFEWDPSIQVP